MDMYEFNKLAGAVLGAGLMLMIINEVGNALVHPETLEKSVLDIALPEAGDAGAPGGAQEEAGPSALELLAQADPEKGERVAKKCAACHTFDQGGANKIGPNLFGVVGRAKAAHEGFSYSDALGEGEWDYRALDQFLADPKGYAPGTKMAFAGIKKADQRADLLAYLRQQHPSPPPLPGQ